MRCPFCGLVHNAASNQSRENTVTQVHVSSASLKRPLRWILAIVMLIVVVSLVPVIAGLYFGWRAVDTAVSSLATTSATPGPSKPARFVPSDLRTAAAGSYEVDAAPPAGGYSAVDAVTALPWALTIAQAWAQDARLERIDVTRMRPGGTLNVQDDPEAVLRYRFRSPARIAALVEQARLSTSARAAVGLFVSIERGTLRASINESTRVSERDSATPPNPAVLPLVKLVAVPTVGKLIADVPFLSGYAIHLADEGWVWYFSTLAGESKPRVRGRDGAVWPYSRAR